MKLLVSRQEEHLAVQLRYLKLLQKTLIKSRKNNRGNFCIWKEVIFYLVSMEIKNVKFGQSFQVLNSFDPSTARGS